MRDVVRSWFQKWEEGDFRAIPVSPEFTHVSPFGTVAGRDSYLAMVEANTEAFLGFRFEIHDELYGSDRACVRYTATRDDAALEVSEWFYGSAGAISQIVSYYNVGEASYDEMNPAADEVS